MAKHTINKIDLLQGETQISNTQILFQEFLQSGGALIANVFLEATPDKNPSLDLSELPEQSFGKIQKVLNLLNSGLLYCWLSWSDADPVVNCVCAQQFVGDSLGDAVLAWTKHVVEKHQEDW